MNEAARKELVEIVRTVGPQLAEEGRKLRSLLSDRCPSMRKEVHALAAGAECRVAVEIRSTSSGLPWSAMAGRFVTKLIDLTAMDEAAARWVVDSWGLALGKAASVPPYTPTSPPPAPVVAPVNVEPQTIAYVPPPPVTYVPPPPTPAPIVYKRTLIDGDALGLIFGGAFWLVVLYIGLTAWLRPTWWGSGVWIASQANLADAHEYLGDLYRDGSKGAEKDPARALHFYTLAAPKQGAQFQHDFARRLETGDGLPENKEEAAKWYRAAAETGHKDAQFRLAKMYSEGFGVEYDPCEAVKWYRKAATQGHVLAMGELAGSLLFGNGVNLNEAEALKWGEKSAQLGDPMGQVTYGTAILMTSEGVPDFGKAAEWIKKSAAQKHDFGQGALAMFAANGWGGVPKDLNESLRLLKLAAVNLDPSVAKTLGDAYCEEVFGQRLVSPDPAESDKWYKRAAQLYRERARRGDGEASLELARLHQKRRLSEATDESDLWFKEAVRLLRKSAVKGDPKSLVVLGKLYLDGEPGIPKDVKAAVDFYRRAAELGDQRGQFALGEFYETGNEAVSKNREIAKEWYTKAADQGHKDAKQKLKNLTP